MADPVAAIAGLPSSALWAVPLTVPGGSTWQQALASLRSALNAERGLREALDAMFAGVGWQTAIGSMSTIERTPTGARLTMRHPGTEPGQREWDVDLDIDESGTLWFSAANVGLPDRNYNGIIYTGVFIDAVAIYVLEVLTFATVLSRELNYASAWDVGLALTNLQGSRPIAAVDTPRATTVGAFGNGYEVARYFRSTRADVSELARESGVVLERLVGQLARAMYADGYLKPLTNARQS